MAVAFDAVGPGVNANAVGSFSYTHTPAGTPTAVALGLGWFDDSGTLTVTYGGAAMTSVESVAASSLKAELFALANPASGAQTVAGNWSLGSHYPIGSTITVTGSDTTTVFSDTNSASGNSGNTSVTVSSAVGELVMAAVMMNNGGVGIGPVSGETERFEAGNSGLQGQIQTAAGASPTVSMDTSSASGGPWVVVAGSFKAAGASTQTITCSGIASTLAFGTAKLNLRVQASGVSSSLAFGSPVVSVGNVTQAIETSGIESTLAFGTARLNLEVEAAGIASTLVFGTAVLNVAGAPQTVVVGGIASTLAFGTAEVVVGEAPQSLILSGIASTLAFGTASLVFEGEQTITVGGISSTLAFGTPIILGGRGVTPGRLPSTPRVAEDKEETQRQRQRFGVVPPDQEPPAEVDREVQTRSTRPRVLARTTSATFEEDSTQVMRRREEEEILLLMAA